MSKRYDTILRGGRSGVYAAPRLVGALRAAAKRAGIAWYELDLKGAADREALLQRCAAVFSLPPYFGGNWDALHECLLDFAGRGTPGAIVHWRRGTELARRAPDAVTTAFRVLKDVAAYWGVGGRTFLVVVDRDGARGRALRPLR
jgi:RNAse (barnase) inhibitor barstar